MEYSAILIGATGLVGKQVLKQLLADEKVTKVLVLTRRSTKVEHPKLKEQLIDFDAINESELVLDADVLYSTLGTTLKAAGSKERQREIDFDMPFNIAKIAANRGVRQMVVLSSAGANENSKVFYSRLKGELDVAVQNLGFDAVQVIRPSMLAGDREEWRWMEKIFTPIMYAFSWVPGIRKYRPIKDVTVARAMLNSVVNNETGVHIYELESIFKLAKHL